MSNFPVKTKLIFTGLISLFFLLLLSFLVIFTTNKIKINGDLYHKIENQNDLIADILPPPMYIIESYLTATRALDKNQNHAEVLEKLKTLEQDFNSRKEYWNTTLANNDAAKSILLDKCYPTGKAFFNLIHSDFEQALKSNNYDEVENIVFGKLKNAYEKHRLAVDELTVVARKNSDDIEKEANKELNIDFFMLTSLLSIYALIIIFIFATLLKNIGGSVEKLQNQMNSFFDFIGHKTTHVDKIDLNSNDEFGKMSKALNENITTIEKELLQDYETLKDAIKCAMNVKSGDFSARININPANPRLIELKNTINEMLDSNEKIVGSDLNQLRAVLNSYFEKDFTKRVLNPNAEIENIINDLGDEISSMLFNALKNSKILTTGAVELGRQVKSLSDLANSQATSLEETATSLEELSSNACKTLEKAESMELNANSTKQAAKDGMTHTEKTVEAMDDILKISSAINDAVAIIDNIAFQTNILSLNAAVEAATAGEAGKGFAVVAGEVRNLAARSAEAAKEIASLAQTAKNKAQDGKNITDKMHDSFKELKLKINETTQIINEVTVATKEQMNGIRQINDAMINIDTLTQTVAVSASETARVSETVANMAISITNDSKDKKFDGKDGILVQMPSKIKNPTIGNDFKTKPINYIEQKHNQEKWEEF